MKARPSSPNSRPFDMTLQGVSRHIQVLSAPASSSRSAPAASHAAASTPARCTTPRSGSTATQVLAGAVRHPGRHSHGSPPASPEKPTRARTREGSANEQRHLQRPRPRAQQRLVEVRGDLQAAMAEATRLSRRPCLRHSQWRGKLSQLFAGRRDLLVIHSMGKGCNSCTMWADGFNGLIRTSSIAPPSVLPAPMRRTCRPNAACSWRFRMWSATLAAVSPPPWALSATRAAPSQASRLSRCTTDASCAPPRPCSSRRTNTAPPGACSISSPKALKAGFRNRACRGLSAPVQGER